MKYCSRVWAVATFNCYRIYENILFRTVYPSLTSCLEPWAHDRDVASLVFLYRYYFVRCSSELDQLAPLTYSLGRSTPYTDRLHDILLTFLGVTVISIPTVFFFFFFFLRS